VPVGYLEPWCFLVSNCRSPILLETSRLLTKFSHVIQLRQLPFPSEQCIASSCTLSSCDERHNAGIRERIIEYNYQWPKSSSSPARTLIEKIFVPPDCRPSLDDIVGDAFFTNQSSYFQHCRLAGVGKNEIGEPFPCVGREEPRSPFWVVGF
jgi:hypothetical protein